MIERHITLHHPARPGPTRSRRSSPASTVRRWPRPPGFVAVNLLRELDSPTRYQMVLRWADAESAAGWRTSTAHEALQPALTGMYADPDVRIQAYEVVV